MQTAATQTEYEDDEETAPDENGFRTRGQYMALTLERLRELASARGLLRRGVKAEVVGRLLRDDQGRCEACREVDSVDLRPDTVATCTVHGRGARSAPAPDVPSPSASSSSGS